MYEFRYLLDRFWITKAEDKELYHTLKRTQPEYKRFLNEQLGWNLIINESVIKLEKVPPKAMPWMGIQEFSDTMDYCLLCALLLYLCDLDDGEQFLLSYLTEAIETFTKDLISVDWTRFTHRKSLVRVLRYAQDIGLILVYDGSSESFSSNQDQEVLYENTGLSRHFPVHFGRDILHCNTVSDFEAFSWEGEDADRGQKRIHRCYQQLTLTPAMYWSEGSRADYEYIKNQRQWVSRHLNEAIGGELHIHRNGAFFVATEDSRFGMLHPRDISEMVREKRSLPILHSASLAEAKKQWQCTSRYLLRFLHNTRKQVNIVQSFWRWMKPSQVWTTGILAPCLNWLERWTLIIS